MNRVSSNPNHGGDDLDALLRAFYQREMPDPWPAFEPPMDRASRGVPSAAPRTLPLRPAAVRSSRVWSSRLALAASVALLLLGTWFLPGFTTQPETSGELKRMGEGTATPRPGLPPVELPKDIVPDKLPEGLPHLPEFPFRD